MVISNILPLALAGVKGAPFGEEGGSRYLGCWQCCTFQPHGRCMSLFLWKNPLRCMHISDLCSFLMYVLYFNVNFFFFKWEKKGWQEHDCPCFLVSTHSFFRVPPRWGMASLMLLNIATSRSKVQPHHLHPTTRHEGLSRLKKNSFRWSGQGRTGHPKEGTARRARPGEPQVSWCF